jgi:hypothetical protein
MTARVARSFLETVLVAEVERDRDTVLAAHFSERERRALDGRSARSVAGDLALKRALVRVAAARDVRAAETDFEIGRAPGGAPAVLVAPDGFPIAPGGPVFISIAHGRQTACGLAVLAENGDA